MITDSFKEKSKDKLLDEDIRYKYCSKHRNPIFHDIGVSRIGGVFYNGKLYNTVNGTTDHLLSITQSTYMLSHIIRDNNVNNNEDFLRLICVLNIGFSIPKKINNDSNYICNNFDEAFEWDKRLKSFDIDTIKLINGNIVSILDVKKVWDKLYYDIITKIIK